MIRRIVVLSALAVVAFAPAAFAAPHHEELDGCDHGATSKSCRPDPQPEHGKECDKHGRHGGVNEDHCATTTTITTPLPTTSTTSAPSPVAPTTTSTTASSSSTTTAPATPSTSSLRRQSPSFVAGPSATTGAPTTATELAHTGLGTTLLIFAGAWLLIGGVITLALAQLIRGAK